MITPGLEIKLKSYKLDISREWTPAKAVATGKGCGPNKVYKRGNPSDHKAKEGKEGNRAILNYDNPEGWLLSKIMSDNYANKIREIVRKYKNKNDRQRAFKQIMDRLDIECFSIEYKQSKSSSRRMGKTKQ